MTFLQVKNITKKGDGNFLLSPVTFSQRRLEKVAIAGETGAGKSTILKIIAGLIQPDAGEVLFQKERVMGPAEKLVPGHDGIAYLSQHFELQKFLRVEQVLHYANSLPEEEADKLFEVCQISHLLKRRTDQLSGGEKQRIAICRLLISCPRLLLLDEPYAHLDPVHKATLKAVIQDIGNKLRITCTIVSHDPLDTLSWADKMLVMKAGRLIQAGRPEVIYQQPVDQYTGGLFGKYNLIRPSMFNTFSRIPAIKRAIPRAGKKSLFIRPEQFRLARKNNSSLGGKVRKVNYFGSHRELEISISGHTITVRTDRGGIETGDAVHVSLGAGPLWLV